MALSISEVGVSRGELVIIVFQGSFWQELANDSLFRVKFSRRGVIINCVGCSCCLYNTEILCGGSNKKRNLHSTALLLNLSYVISTIGVYVCGKVEAKSPFVD